MKWPRYEVHSITGYSTTGVPGEGKPSTTWWVADTWNCYRECLLTAILSGADDKPTGKRIAQRRRPSGAQLREAEPRARRMAGSR